MKTENGVRDKGPEPRPIIKETLTSLGELYRLTEELNAKWSAGDLPAGQKLLAQRQTILVRLAQLEKASPPGKWPPDAREAVTGWLTKIRDLEAQTLASWRAEAEDQARSATELRQTRRHLQAVRRFGTPQGGSRLDHQV